MDDKSIEMILKEKSEELRKIQRLEKRRFAMNFGDMTIQHNYSLN